MFNHAAFSGHPGFYGATFSGTALFNQATFSGAASFSEATFSGDAVFTEATFSGGAWFNKATFSGDAVFDGVTFSSGTAWFKGGPDTLSFQGALVKSPGRAHVWPEGWQLQEQSTGQTIITRINSSTSPDPS